MFNFGDMMGKIQEMQSRLKAVREEMEDILVDAEAGGGMVRVTANANRRILKIEIDPDIVDKNDLEIMNDLITAAVNKALDKAEARGREELEKATKNIMPNLPGFDLSKLGLT
ncbi:MAG: YbaB/EbfC family nucleoid-associated protein [Bacteroidetes bacterium]|nr:MAG: YbaB/EbfC family nucleoid-associated protein [Bacteroidota bacterium]